MPFQYKLADNTMPTIEDDEYQVFHNGVQIPYGIQLTEYGQFVANQYAPEGTPDDDWWMCELESSRDINVCKAAIEAHYDAQLCATPAQ